MTTKITLHHGDSLPIMAMMPNASFDAIVTDPPYASGGLKAAERKQVTSRKYQSTGAQTIFEDFYGDGLDQRAYMRWSTMWLNEARRLLKDGGNLLCFIDWRQLPTLTDAVQCADFMWRGVAVWDKLNSRPNKNGIAQEAEFVIWATKGSIPDRYNPVYLRGVWRHPIVSTINKDHATQKPVALMRDLLKLVPQGGAVLDPFMGSGSTLVAAQELGLTATGIEKSEHYYNVAQHRVATGRKYEGKKAIQPVYLG